MRYGLIVANDNPMAHSTNTKVESALTGHNNNMALTIGTLMLQ